jgi:hypothetical protein
VQEDAWHIDKASSPLTIPYFVINTAIGMESFELTIEIFFQSKLVLLKAFQAKPFFHGMAVYG